MKIMTLYKIIHDTILHYRRLYNTTQRYATLYDTIQGESKKTDTFDIQMNNKGVSFF